jgi:hypothetical protein
MGLKKLHMSSRLQIIKIVTKNEDALEVRIDPRLEGVLDGSLIHLFPMIRGPFGTEGRGQTFKIRLT